MLDLSREFTLIRDEVMAAIEDVCARQQFILGPAAQRFEEAAAAFCRVPAAIGCASGTDALWLALAACGLGPGDAVITTPFSFFATASAILRAGAHPVFADIDPGTFNLSPQSVAETLTKPLPPGLHYAAILPVHLYGQCADMDALSALARDGNLKLIEDAAQAFGAAWRGQAAGSLGDAAAFSFYPTKNLAAFGDAGMLTATLPATADRARALRNHGMRRRYFHEEFNGHLGWNSRLDGIQAAILEIKLRRLPAANARRRELATLYDTLFTQSGLADNSFPPQKNTVISTGAQPIGETRVLRGEPVQPNSPHPIQLPQTDPRATPIFHQYVIRTPHRDALRAHLTAHNIGTEIYYPLPLHLQEGLAFLNHQPGDFPQAEAAAHDVLALPIYPELREDEIEAVVSAITAFFN